MHTCSPLLLANFYKFALLTETWFFYSFLQSNKEGDFYVHLPVVNYWCLITQITWKADEVLSNIEARSINRHQTCGSSMDIERLTQFFRASIMSAKISKKVAELSIEHRDN